MDGFDLTGISIPESVHMNGYGDVASPRKTIVRFEWKPVELKALTQLEGIPKFENRLFCEQRIPGSKDQPGEVEVRFKTNIRGQKVPDPENLIVRRYPAELKRFLETGEAPREGVPLEQWARLTKERVAVCHYLDIRTIEELAGCDGNEEVIRKLGPGGRELIKQADAYLRSQNDTAVAEKLAAEKQQLLDQVTMMQKQMIELAERLDAKEKKKNG